MGPLPESDSRELLLRQGVTGSDQAIADTCAQLGGNPRLLIMLCEVLLKRRCKNLDEGLSRFPELVNRAAVGLLAEVWSELSETGRFALQTMSVLRPPVAVADLLGVAAILDPGRCEIDNILWDELLPRSLVVANDDGTTFAFEHLLIRDYALRQWPDTTVPHRAAVKHFLQIADGASSEVAALACQLAVIHHALACGDFDLTARSLTDESIKKPMQREGRHIEMLDLCRPVVASSEKLDPLLRIKIRRLTGALFDATGDYSTALKLHEACRDELGPRRDSEEGCMTLTELCSVLRKLQRCDEAETIGQEALAISRNHGLVRSETWALAELAAVSRNQGKPAEAARRARTLLEVAERFGEPMPRIVARIALARPMLGGGNLKLAQQYFQEAHRSLSTTGARPH